MESLHFKEEGEREMEEMMISNTSHCISSTSTPWKLYHNPLYSRHPYPSVSDLTFGMEATTKSMQSELEDARAQIIDLKAELHLERKFRKKSEYLTKTMAKDLDDERRGREAAERACDELGIQAFGHEADIGRIRKEIDDEKKMMRVAEVFREDKVEAKLKHGLDRPFNKKLSSSYNERRAASPEPENPHIKRGIKGSVEFQRVVKAMCSNKSSKQLDGNYKLECQKAQLKILLKQTSRFRPDNFFIT